MYEWINHHGVIVVVLIKVFSGLVSMIPSEAEVKTARPGIDPLSLLIYSKLYIGLHLAADNWAKVISQLRIYGNGNGKKDQ